MIDLMIVVCLTDCEFALTSLDGLYCIACYDNLFGRRGAASTPHLVLRCDDCMVPTGRDPGASFAPPAATL